MTTKKREQDLQVCKRTWCRWQVEHSQNIPVFSHNFLDFCKALINQIVNVLSIKY